MILLLAALAQEVSVDALKRSVETLSADAMEGRCSGMPGAERAAEWIVAEFKRVGLQAPADGWLQPFEMAALTDPSKKLVGQNVVAILPGSDEKLRKEYVVVGAHYDGVGLADDPNPPGRLPGEDPKDVVWNGADDNASGVAAMLEIARLLAAAIPRRSVLFVAFGGEEFASVGASRFVRSVPAPAAFDGLTAMVNLHMLGRNPGRKLQLLSSDSSAGWPKLLDEAARGLIDLDLSHESPVSGDQWSFTNGRVPAVALFGGFHEDYHAPADSAEKISWEALSRRTHFAWRLVVALAELPNRLTWTAPRAPGLGIQGLDLTDEEATRLELPAGRGGVRVAEIAQGSPAEKAGLKAGDVLLEFGSQILSRDGAKGELVRAIKSVRPGDEVKIVVLRERERRELTVVWPAE